MTTLFNSQNTVFISFLPEIIEVLNDTWTQLQIIQVLSEAITALPETYPNLHRPVAKNWEVFSRENINLKCALSAYKDTYKGIQHKAAELHILKAPVIPELRWVCMLIV